MASRYHLDTIKYFQNFMVWMMDMAMPQKYCMEVLKKVIANILTKKAFVYMYEHYRDEAD